MWGGQVWQDLALSLSSRMEETQEKQTSKHESYNKELCENRSRMAKCLLSVYLLGEGNQMGVLTFISWERHIWTKLLNNSWLTKQLATEETKWRMRMWKLRSCRTVSSLEPNFLKDTGLLRSHCNMQTILGKDAAAQPSSALLKQNFSSEDTYCLACLHSLLKHCI